MIDVEAAPLVDVVARVRAVAAERGVELGRERARRPAAGERASPTRRSLGLDALPDDRVLERRLDVGLALTASVRAAASACVAESGTESAQMRHDPAVAFQKGVVAPP